MYLLCVTRLYSEMFYSLREQNTRSWTTNYLACLIDSIWILLHEPLVIAAYCLNIYESKYNVPWSETRGFLETLSQKWCLLVLQTEWCSTTICDRFNCILQVYDYSFGIVCLVDWVSQISKYEFLLKSSAEI
jgi:hypothetical protein